MGYEDTTIVSAFSQRVLALHDGAAAWVGSWGCRMFRAVLHERP